MPELPEVETIRQGLLGLIGQEVARVEVRVNKLRWPVPDQLNTRLSGSTIRAITRRAKYLLMTFPHGTVLWHLGMSGNLRLLPHFCEPQKHDHVDLFFHSGMLLRFRDPRRFGALLWVEGDPYQHPLLHNLGPEPWDKAADAVHLYPRLVTRCVAIKQALMDARLVVGIGNIYANEVLFQSGIHPSRPACSLSFAEGERLIRAVHQVLNAALQAGGSTLRDFVSAEGNRGYFQQQYFVYGRQGQACRICGGIVEQMRQAQRSSYYCPHCQR